MMSDEDMIHCRECGATSSIDDCDGSGACPGNLFCGFCDTEIDTDSGCVALLCGECDGCQRLKENGTFDETQRRRHEMRGTKIPYVDSSQGYTTMDEVVGDLLQLCNSLPIDPSECYMEHDWQSRAIPLVAKLLYHGRRYLEAADREHARVQQHLSELINEASDGGHDDE